MTGRMALIPAAQLPYAKEPKPQKQGLLERSVPKVEAAGRHVLTSEGVSPSVLRRRRLAPC
jgi:hypothetical protein